MCATSARHVIGAGLILSARSLDARISSARACTPPMASSSRYQKRRLHLPDGTIYDGELRDDEMHGNGCLTMPDGTVYDGEWAHGRHHGQGKLTLDSGYVYDGAWLDGKRCGHGVMTDDAGRRYEGEWSAGKQHGVGTIFHLNGDVWSGEWSAGQMHGKGVLTRKSGSILRGTWVQNKKTTDYPRLQRLALRALSAIRPVIMQPAVQIVLIVGGVHALRAIVRSYVLYAAEEEVDLADVDDDFGQRGPVEPL